MVLPIEFNIKTLITKPQVGLDLSEAQEHHLNQVSKLNEIRQVALQHTTLTQHQRDKLNDGFIKKIKLKEGDWSLLFDSKYKDF